MKEDLIRRFRFVCKRILEIPDKPGRFSSDLPYAQGYAKKGLELSSLIGIEDQIIRILDNFKSCRNTDAPTIRTELRAIKKEIVELLFQSNNQDDIDLVGDLRRHYGG